MRGLSHLLASLLGAACLLSIAAAEPANLAFRPAEAGYCEFDTGLVRGVLRLDGHSQGIVSLVDVQSEAEIAAGGELPGVFSFYRVFSADTRYGDAARDWPTIPKLLPDGAVEVHWPPADEHPLEITAVYRWSAPDVLDLETTVKPLRDMPRFELFLSSYFAKEMAARVYVKPNHFAQGQPELAAADVNPLVDGTYLMFPRDRQAVQMIFDRRWEMPPNPVQWSVTRWLAGPMALRRNERIGLAAVVMAPPNDCFAVATPYNKTPPDGVAGHNSLYLSLFGRDVKAGESARARSRLMVGKLSDQEAIRRYEAYVAELKP